MLTDNHLAILAKLRSDARMSLAKIGRETGLPTSTVFDYYQDLLDGAIARHVTIPDFGRLGCPLRKRYLVRTADRKRTLAWLKSHPNVNDLYRVDSHDAFFEAYFPDVNAAETFRDSLKQALRPRELKEFDILEEIKHEGFAPKNEP